MIEVSGTVDFTPWMPLVAPNGAVVGNNQRPTSATLNVTAATTGTYTIILGTADTGNDASGSYSLSVSGVNRVPRPTMVSVADQPNLFTTSRFDAYGAEWKASSPAEVPAWSGRAAVRP